MIEWKVSKVTCIIEGKNGTAQERVWIPGGGTEIPYTYFPYGAKLYNKFVRSKIRECQNTLTF